MNIHPPVAYVFYIQGPVREFWWESGIYLYKEIVKCICNDRRITFDATIATNVTKFVCLEIHLIT